MYYSCITMVKLPMQISSRHRKNIPCRDFWCGTRLYCIFCAIWLNCKFLYGIVSKTHKDVKAFKVPGGSVCVCGGG